MEIELDNQPPNCNQTLSNFVHRYKDELIDTSQRVKILFFERELPQLNPFVKWIILYLEFQNPKFDDNIVRHDLIGINKGKGRVKFKNGNVAYYLINGLLIKDGKIEKGNDKAITIRLNSLGDYLTDKCFNVDGSELAKNKRLIICGD